MLILLLPLLALLCVAAVLLRRSRPAAARLLYRLGIAAAVLPYLLHLHHARGYVIGFGDPEPSVGIYPGLQAYTAASLAAAALALGAGWHLAGRRPLAAALVPAALWAAYWFACLPLVHWRAPGFVRLDNVPLVWLFGVSAFATVLLGATGWAVRRRGSAPPSDAAASLPSPAAVRSRYPDAGRCVCVAGGEPCAPDRLSVRTMNFGQPWRTEGMTEVAYRAEVPLAYAEDILREHVADYVQDSRDHPDPDDEYDRALAAAGHPDTEQVLATPELRDPLLGFFRYEILGWWFGTGHPEREPGFVLNTVDRIEVAGGIVVYHGTARRSGMPVRYQDV